MQLKYLLCSKSLEIIVYSERIYIFQNKKLQWAPAIFKSTYCQRTLRIAHKIRAMQPALQAYCVQNFYMFVYRDVTYASFGDRTKRASRVNHFFVTQTWKMLPAIYIYFIGVSYSISSGRGNSLALNYYLKLSSDSGFEFLIQYLL